MSQGKILVAEDEMIIARDVQNTLRRAGYEVPAIASTGEEAIMKAEEHRPDLVLMDIVLQGKLDGIQAASRIVSHFDIPVAYLTSFSDKAVIDRAKATDPVAFITKPYEERSFVTSVDMALNYQRAVRKKISTMEQESAERFKKVFDHAPISKALIGLDGHFLKVNRALWELTGYSERELTEKKFQDIIVTDNGKHGIDPLHQILVGENRVYQAEGRCYHRLGHELHVLLNFSAVEYKKDTPRRIILQVLDITTRKQAEEALRISEQRYRRLVKATTSYIYTVTVKNGRPISTTHEPGCVFVTGYRAEEYEANPNLWYLMVCEEHRGEVVKQANMILEGKAVSPLEHRIFHKDGTIRYVRNTPVPNYDENGKLVSYDGLITNITAERKLKDQLHQAQKMEAVGQLAGGIAHDFNNILTAIIGYGTILTMKLNENHVVRPEVEQILGSAERAAKLTERLLAFSRKQSNNPAPMKTNEVVHRVEKLLSMAVGEDIQLKYILSEADPTIKADSWQLEQVLVNLATNARDAMPQGGVLSIETGMTALDSEFIKTHGFGEIGDYSFIKVTDTGTGMDEETQKRIFEPFYTTKEVGKGTGLGLSIVYGIVKQHKGYVTVSSEPGEGAAFTIYLPIADAIIGEQKIFNAVVPVGGKETVLLAEDDEHVRSSTKTLLERYGYTVIEAMEGEDAINKFLKHQQSIDLLVLDVVMPKKTGKEAYEAIRKINPAIRALFTSGYAEDIVQQKGIVEQEVNFVSKPISPALYLTKIRQVLDA